MGGGLNEEVQTLVAHLGGICPADLGDQELADTCLAWTTLVNVVLVQSGRFLAELQQRGTWAQDGATSASAWVGARTGEPRAELATRARVGAGLRRLPTVAAAAARGEIGFDHARRIVDCARHQPAFSTEHEAVLLESARTFDVATFRAVAKEWRAKAEDTTDHDPPAETPPRREFVHFSQTLDGWYRLDGDLSPDNGALLAAYFEEHLDKALRAQRDGDPALQQQPVSALRAEALVDLVNQHQRREPSDHSVPDRYRVAVVVRPDQHPMATCDADRYRAVMNTDGEVLDIGRTNREWTTPIRRAVTLRDQRCVFPGCDRPPSWCDIHHCTPWNHGGPTSADNGALLCRRHHTFIHTKHWRVVIPKPRGKPQTLQPDGTPFTIQLYRAGLEGFWTSP